MIRKKRKIRKRESFRAIIAPAVIIISISIFLGFLFVSNLRIYQRRSEFRKRAEDLQKEVDLLIKRNEELKAGISQTERSEYWEEKLYEQGYKKPGEEVLVVLPPEGEEGEGKEEKGFWQTILEALRF